MLTPTAQAIIMLRQWLFNNFCYLLPGRYVFVKVIGVIPARYDSTRFAGKVLAKATGKYLVQHTYESALRAGSLSEVIIAADSEKVARACDQFNGRCLMTSPSHPSGTDRVAEAAAKTPAEIIVNIQADEPEIDPAHIDLLVSLLIKDPQAEMATLVTNFDSADEIADPNCVKAVVGRDGTAIYFSRSVVPYHRKTGGIGPIDLYRRHLGIYAYRRDFLLKITGIQPTPLEKAESLEQLRALETGCKILTAFVEHYCPGIDTENQYKQFVARYNNVNHG